MNGDGMLMSTLIEITPGWVGLVFGAALLIAAVSAALIAVGVCRWLGRDQQEQAAADGCWCGSCGIEDDENEPEQPDDLTTATDAAFIGGGDVLPKPVNEPRGGRWPGLNVTGLNAGAWLDDASRQSTENNSRWISSVRQRKLGEVLTGEVEQFLVAAAAAEQARQKRWDAIRDSGFERGEPGE